MREILFRGKRTDNGERAYGDLIQLFGGQEYIIDNKFGACIDDKGNFINTEAPFVCKVIPETVGQYTGLKDKNGKKIFEGDIVQYLTYSDFDCQSTVKFGVYKQDGSDGEYKASNCLGFYVELDNFTCPDWYDNEPEMLYDYLKQQSLAEIASQCEVIGNVYDNPELIRNEV